MLYSQRPYFQKSLRILYPLTGITKTATFKPTNTYLYWSGEESIENYELIVLFKETGLIFPVFERETLLRNEKLTKGYEIDNSRIYIFDLIEYAWDIAHFIYGDYSKISNESKVKILSYYGIANSSKDLFENPVDMTLNPGKYYKEIGKELELDSLAVFKESRELTPLFDKEKETLITNIGEITYKRKERIIYI